MLGQGSRTKRTKRQVLGGGAGYCLAGVGDFGHKEYRHDRDHDRRHAGDQRAEEVRGGKDTSRPPGAPEVTTQGMVD